jgi:hypothetical protein
MIKLPLEINDIYTISISKTIKFSIKNLPVMVTDAMSERDGIHYKVCSKHRHLAGTYSRSEPAYRKVYSKRNSKNGSIHQQLQDQATIPTRIP